jgi:ubiquinone/menaquinone biosynthesis C-methylase UbiE
MNGIRRDPEQREARWLKRYINWQNAQVLEIGCGDGRVTRKIVRPVARIIGIDINRAQIKKAHQSRRDLLKEKVRFLVASAVILPFSEGTFDVVALSWSY